MNEKSNNDGLGFLWTKRTIWYSVLHNIVRACSMFYPYEELEFIETKGSRYIAQTAVVAGQHVAQQQQRRVMAVAQPTAPTRL